MKNPAWRHFPAASLAATRVVEAVMDPDHPAYSDDAITADRHGVPYEQFCRHRAECEGRQHCPLDPTCAD